MMNNPIYLCLLSSLALFHPLSCVTPDKETTYEELPFTQPGHIGKDFEIYCYEPKTGFPVVKSFSSLYVSIRPPDSQHFPVFFYGNNASKVQEGFNSQSILPAVNLWKRLDTRLSVLHHNCLGVDCGKECILTSELRKVDLLYVGLFAAGLAIFLFAPVLSQSVYFHYSSGVTIGILASLLIVIYIISRFIPKKIGAIAFLVSGWTLVVYTIREAWDSLLSSEYREYIIAYFTVAGILSFVICYWYGPVKNERTIHILEGALYLMAVLLMYGGIQHKPTAVAVIALLGSITYLKRKGVLPSRLPQFHWRWKKRHFHRGKKRLLTNEEFEQQGIEETRKALEQLREYCNSPQCNAWKMISKMESPERFAQFVLGDDHISENELTLYESDMSTLPEESLLNGSLMTSDSDANDDE